MKHETQNELLQVFAVRIVVEAEAQPEMSPPRNSPGNGGNGFETEMPPHAARSTDTSREGPSSCMPTTAANEPMSGVHDRMPVILSPDNFNLWLDSGFARVADLTQLLKPYSGRMRRYLVSSRVNAVAYDDAACAEPVTLKEAQCGLF